MSNPTIVRTVTDLRAALAPLRKAGTRIGLVPTMGALHSGHLSLVEIAAKAAPHVVVSLFVNPTQFAPHEDFTAYPRTEEADLKALAGSAARLIFAPNAAEMYPADHATTVKVGGPASGLETEFRPHFFAGVATVVAKLFGQCAPDAAVFGEKDYQQLLVIRRMAQDLALPIEIIGAPVIREADGLALSSRNVYLSPAERKLAPVLHARLKDAAAAIRNGVPVAAAEAEGAKALLAAGFASVDYFAIRDAETLEPLAVPGRRPARVLVAARLGKTRLIDNIAV
jgi:pantoate--beta-alanine ligase